MTLLKRSFMAHGLTASDVARALKVSPSAVHYWTSGARLPSAEFIPKLARMLSIDPLTLTRMIVPEPGGTPSLPVGAPT